jgi:hypothetical protein
LLKFESDLVCVPCRHGKMIAASHSPVNTVMTEYPGQLLHMDTVGPSQICSMGGKWYVLVIVDDYFRYSWVFFLERKDEVFEHFWLLALRMNNEHPNCLKAICGDNGNEFRKASRVEGEIVSESGALSHIQKAHPPQQIIGNLNERVTHFSRSAHLSYFSNTLFVALFEPRDVGHTLSDSSRVNAMHKELANFERNQVWTLVKPPRDVNIIGTKWVFKNK